MMGPHALLYVTSIRKLSPCMMSTDTYITRRKMNHYVYDDATTVTTPIECATIIPENVSPTRKEAQEVCEPTGGSIFAYMGRV